MLALAAISLFVDRRRGRGHRAVVLLALVTAAYDAVLRVADERFPFVRTVGLALWTVLLAVVLVHRFASLGGAAATLDAWRGAALYGTELALVAIKWFWIVLAPLLLLWIVAGLVAQRGGYERSASVATGRLGIGVSLCAFVVVTMALWALLSNLLDLSLKGVGYLPEIFPAPPRAAGQSTRAGLPAAALRRQHRDLRAAGDPAAHAARLRDRHPVPERARRADGDPRQGPRAGAPARRAATPRPTAPRSGSSSSAPRRCASAAG